MESTPVRRPETESTTVKLSTVFSGFAVLALGFGVQLAQGFFQTHALAAVLVAVALSAIAVASPRISVELPFAARTIHWGVYLTISALYLLLGFSSLHTHHPSIDVLVYENDSARSLLLGQNPYARGVTHQVFGGSPGVVYYGPGIFEEGRVQVGFPYPPLTLFWVLPGYFIGDVRYSFLLAVFLTSLLIFLLSPDPNGLIAAGLLLFVPETFFVLAMGWTEPLMLITLAITIFSACKAPRILPVALGLFLASKQYSLLAVPLAALLLPKFSWKSYLSLVIGAGAVAAVITLPFALWDYHGFWWSLVTFQVAAPFRPDALSISALLARHGLSPVPQWLIVAAVLATTVFALNRSPRTPSGFAASLALVSLIFFVANKQAFCNYYFFSAGTLCLSIASAGRDPSTANFILARQENSVPAPQPVQTIESTSKLATF